jgi:prevent-host-death family protein
VATRQALQVMAGKMQRPPKGVVMGMAETLNARGLAYLLEMGEGICDASGDWRAPVALVEQAEAGVEVELTRRGRPVAVLVSRREFGRLRGKRLHFGDAYKKFLEKHSLEEIGVEDVRH